MHTQSHTHTHHTHHTHHTPHTHTHTHLSCSICKLPIKGHMIPLSKNKQKLVVMIMDHTSVDAQLGPQHSSSNNDNVGIERLHAAHKLALLSHLSIYVTSNHLI